MKILKLGMIVLGIALLGVIAVACSNGSNDGTTYNPATATPAVMSIPPTTPAPTTEPTVTSTPKPMHDPAPLPTTISIVARDSVFDVQPAQGVPGTIEAPANSDITVKLFNAGVLPHNIAFYTSEGGKLLAKGANGSIILEGESTTVRFKTPGPGTYFFLCAVHPQQMIGNLIVK